MRLVTFRQQNRTAPGLLLEGGRVLDLSDCLPGKGRLASLIDIVRAGEEGEAALRQAAKGAGAKLDLKDIRLIAPIPWPRKNVFCVGRNYVEHVAEGFRARGTEMKLPEYAQFFTKPLTAIIGPDADIPLDAEVTQKLDYEVELGVVIGKRGRNIPRESALAHVFGYTIINDVTARDLQRRHDQWFKGKSLDGSCPMGPCLVHGSAVADPQSLDLLADPQQLLFLYSQYFVRILHWGRASSTDSDLFCLSIDTVSQVCGTGKLPEVHRRAESSCATKGADWPLPGYHQVNAPHGRDGA